MRATTFLLAAIAFGCGPGAFAGDPGPRDLAAVSVVPEREISIEQLHLGLTPGGRVGRAIACGARMSNLGAGVRRRGRLGGAERLPTGHRGGR